jgi:uncharacterized phage protein gp47/JayE
MKTRKASNQATQEASSTSLDSDNLAQLKAENLELRTALELAQVKIELLNANLADLRLIAGRSIETLETQRARRKLFGRNK